ncbi:hypothetical protein MJO28_001471 [Puccinia striiformis f. sp. tritici]|uniref:Uncharacterized protein n=1 Tax=Puccinia striiformis f. sp. tritici TaxID=168172 RepID=A0ACC0EU17_9BASI|nr:hypothetical protein MJO28_001471 [Puccinia striiformis f. sp. tritici]
MNTSVAVDETNIVLSQTSQTPKKAAAKTGKKTNMAITKPVQGQQAHTHSLSSNHRTETLMNKYKNQKKET